MSAFHSDMALPEPSSCLGRLIERLRSLSELGRAPELPFANAIAALLVHAASLQGPPSQVRRARIVALLRDYMGCNEAAVTSLVNDARREDDRAVDLHRFARVVNRALPQEGRLAVFQMAAEVAFAESAGAVEEGFLRLLGGLLGISDYDRGIVQHRVRMNRQALSSTSRS